MGFVKRSTVRWMTLWSLSLLTFSGSLMAEGDVKQSRSPAQAQATADSNRYNGSGPFSGVACRVVCNHEAIDFLTALPRRRPVGSLGGQRASNPTAYRRMAWPLGKGGDHCLEDGDRFEIDTSIVVSRGARGERISADALLELSGPTVNVNMVLLT